MKLNDYNFDLPEKLIAQSPVLPRDQCRLLTLDKKTGKIFHHIFYEIIDFLQPGDLLVLNNSKVFPARLFGQRFDTGGKVEILLNKDLGDGVWEVIGKGLKVGTKIKFKNSLLLAEVHTKYDKIFHLKFNFTGDKFFSELNKIGTTPLPPYIKRKPEIADKENYQTVYAKKTGSVAAPTAGLHFTPDLLKRIKAKGIKILEITLHVGLGTFSSIEVDDFKTHKMHEEFFSVPKDVVSNIKKTKKDGYKVIAVGTTTTRVLEHIFSGGIMKTKAKDFFGSTNIFIYPGYRFKCVDSLVTNFHLPKTTLLLLVSALAGKENIKKAYDEAIKREYRFFSYGDAMLIK